LQGVFRRSRLLPAAGLFLAALYASTVPAGEASGIGPLESEEIRSRREALESWTFEPVALDDTVFLFHLDRRDGSFFFQDQRTGVKWFSSWGRRGFASVLLEEDAGAEAAGSGTGSAWVPLDRVEGVRATDREIRFQAKSRASDVPAVRFEVRILPGKDGISLRYELDGDARQSIARLRLVDGALWIADSVAGGVALPAGLGEWHPVDGPRPWSTTHGGPPPEEPSGSPLRSKLDLPFLSPVKAGNPLLITWDDAGLAATVERRFVGGDEFPGTGGLFISVESAGDRGGIEIRTLGKEHSPVVDAAQAYFTLTAAGSGERLAGLRYKTGLRPELRSFVGAAMFRPDLSRGDDFASIALWATRIRDTLGIDRAAFVLRGWSREAVADREGELAGFRARNDAGGDAGLAGCSRRIRGQGHLFGLELEVAPAGEGSPAASRWTDLLFEARNQAGFELLGDLCAPQMLVLRHPPPGQRGTDSPAERAARESLGRLARETFGLVGYSPPVEADLPHSVYFEGLLDGFPERPVDPVFWPVFTAAYGHCVRLGVSPARALRPDDPVGVLAHMLLGEVPCYELPREGATQEARSDEDPRWTFARGEGWAEGRQLSRHEIFLKNTYEVLSHLARQRSRERLLFHRALVPDASVRESFFGPDLRVVVNFGPRPYEDPEGGFVLPPLGFLVRHPFLLAFHATRMQEVTYESPAFFVVRSLEGKMYLRAERVLIYHGWGPSRIDLGGKTFHVETEAVVKIW
jgi:hypothetical protein